jgi:hypothetical protein
MTPTAQTDDLILGFSDPGFYISANPCLPAGKLTII